MSLSFGSSTQCQWKVLLKHTRQSFKKRNPLSCLSHLEIHLQCGTYSTEDAPLPAMAEAALEGWCRLCARCGAIHPVRSVWRPLVAHCPSGLQEKHKFSSCLHLSFSSSLNTNLQVLKLSGSIQIRPAIRVSEDTKMSVMNRASSEIWLLLQFQLTTGHYRMLDPVNSPRPN